ncbi:hypothetical protein BD309DRAFT_960544 [Dichomitus squalens]|uniref:Uncharacterized protein n=1 Tax=Dichomitus squalens TaxID=114155 RepID=A0A4Q9PZX1_9APHY|nr:hypothetical protein BD309DRAFT_960544 [Dichomitus squalens]TBU60180.1 hypothetical protein BD310DRAFT_923479 [Dichomitus squalens]
MVSICSVSVSGFSAQLAGSLRLCVMIASKPIFRLQYRVRMTRAHTIEICRAARARNADSGTAWNVLYFAPGRETA